MTEKIIKELCVMTLKNYEKSEGELTCRFKIGISNMTDYDLSTGKSQKFTL